ncbi:MAG: hypothetical protein ABIN36_13510 [Ferruginibacter sp.]
MRKILYTSGCCLLLYFSSAAFAVTAVSTAASCPNVYNGAIIVIPGGGVAPYFYSLNGGLIVSSNTFTGLAAGTYNILVTDAMGNTGSTTVFVTVAGFLSSSSTSVSVCSNELPYQFNNINIYGPGFYSDTLTNITGCDSIITLNVSIIPVASSLTNVTICTSQVPYFWNGQNYSSSGVYTKTFPAPSGCDSIATLNLNVSNADIWLGTVNSSWEEPANWSCGVPGPTSDVIIDAGTVVIHANTTINSISLGPSANLTVLAGVVFLVLN